MSKGAASDKAIISAPSGLINFHRRSRPDRPDRPGIHAGSADANITNALMKKKEPRSNISPVKYLLRGRAGG